jgi:hypothetical protein
VRAGATQIAAACRYGKYKLKPAVSTGWQSFLAQLSIRLAQARDQRLALLQPNKAIGPRALGVTAIMLVANLLLMILY